MLHKQQQEQVERAVNDYISRHPCEFLNATKQCCDNDDNSQQLNLKESWFNLLTLKKSTFMKGWKPISNQFDTLYDQLFYHYFEYPNETEKYIRNISATHPFIWIPPNWFEQTELLPSGRMGQVYLSQCRFPWRTKKLIVREINLCLILNSNLDSCPNEIFGITAIRSKKACCRKLALVSIAAKTSLEQLITQADQWSFQKLFRTALLLSSAVRDCQKPHPNLQPNNIMLFEDSHFTLIDVWPSIPSPSTYGRYPYIAPERNNIYALGIMLWQLASGVIFPQSLPLTPSVYGITPLSYIDPGYQDLIIQCLQKNPPSAQHVCDALVRILMTEMACPSQFHQQHIEDVQDRQAVVLKYLISNNASKRDINNVLHGASITRRMRVHVALSLDPIFHWQQKEKKPTTQRRISSPSDEHHFVQKKLQEYHQDDTNQQDNGSLYDLPELMQIGFA